MGNGHLADSGHSPPPAPATRFPTWLLCPKPLIFFPLTFFKILKIYTLEWTPGRDWPLPPSPSCFCPCPPVFPLGCLLCCLVAFTFIYKLIRFDKSAPGQWTPGREWHFPLLPLPTLGFPPPAHLFSHLVACTAAAGFTSFRPTVNLSKTS